VYIFGIAHDELTAEDIAARLRKAEERKAQALAQYEAASAEVAWLRDGLRLFDPDADLGNEADPEAIVTELFPDGDLFGDNGIEPTLRQAVVVVMREQPGRRWTVTELAQALDKKGWLPQNGAKRVSDMAGDMVRMGQVLRPRRGIYVLSPEVAAALEAAPGSKE
jgi:hypothetical protein